MMKKALLLCGVSLMCLTACDGFNHDQAFRWQLPEGTPPPMVPKDNPMSNAKVALGRHLFYDKRLSGNETLSCGSCHHQDKAFTDGLKGSVGITGDITARNAMSLTNVAYNQNFTWANPLATKLEHQARFPLFGESPIEMGLSGKEQMVLDKLKQDEIYQQLFKQSFSDGNEPFTMDNVIKAISAFQRTLLSFDSPYDRYLRGEKTTFGASEKRGMQLFFSERAECFHCHGGFNLSDSARHENDNTPAQRFHNNGLYNIDGLGGYPKSDRGLYDLTANKNDMGKFKAPSLRNIELTAPYMHDGSINTLEEVVDHYISGGRDIREGPNKGFGSINPYKSEFIPGLMLSAQEREDLLNFLRSLTDKRFMTNPAFSDPWLN